MENKCTKALKDAKGCDIKLKTQCSVRLIFHLWSVGLPYSKTKQTHRNQTINRKEVLLSQTWNKDVAIVYKIPAQVTLSASVTAQNHICKLCLSLSPGKSCLSLSTGCVLPCSPPFSRGSFPRAMESKPMLRYCNSKRHTYWTTRCIW